MEATQDQELRDKMNQLVREAYAQVLAGLITYTRDITIAEEVLQEALLSASEHWPKEGFPKSAAAWLNTVARRKYLDHYRHQRLVSQHKESEIQENEAALTPYMGDEMGDDRLKLIFTCCHPALSLEAQVALTLRCVAGLDTPKVAAALMVSQTTLQQRLVRAKKKINAANIPYRIPKGDALVARSNAVLNVIYLMFNEGWRSNVQAHHKSVDLVLEAIQFIEIFNRLLPKIPEALGLASLMWLHESRRTARQDESGMYVPLEKQDREQWDQRAIKRGLALLKQATLLHDPGPYQLQATISAAHAEAKSAAQTDWKTISSIYRMLSDIAPSPVVELNRAVVLARVAGAQTGLDLLLSVEQDLQDYQPFYAAKAALLERLHRFDEALLALEQAIQRSQDPGEVRYLQTIKERMQIR